MTKKKNNNLLAKFMSLTDEIWYVSSIELFLPFHYTMRCGFIQLSNKGTYYFIMVR